MIVILGAMDAEISEFLTGMAGRVVENWAGGVCHHGRLDGHEVIVARSGVGKVMAAMTTQFLIGAYKPRALLFTGLAGSLRPYIRIGDTIIARDLVQHDIDATVAGFPRGNIPYTPWRFIESDPDILAVASSFVSAEGAVHAGRICTGDQFITHREMESHSYLSEELAGDAVEMEGAAVALVCAIHKVRFLVARTISDMADASAGVDFSSFLPRASRNSLALVRHLLPLIK